MKNRLTFACVIGISLALGAPAWSTGPAPTDQTLLSAKKKHRVHHPRRPAGQIACTPAGCHRIPPNCHPEAALDFWGNPSGFDRIICSRG
jgi:hypothetical protein